MMKMKMKIKIKLLIVIIVLLTACTTSFEPITETYGYQVLRSGEKSYRIEYIERERTAAHKSWETAASLACSGEYTVLYSYPSSIETGSYTIPIGGASQRFGIFTEIFEGEVECKNLLTPAIQLAASNWYIKRSPEQRVPVSPHYLSVRYALNLHTLDTISTLAASTSPEKLNELLGKPNKVLSAKEGDELYWSLGRSLLVIARQHDCITSVKLAGDGFIILLADMMSKVEAPVAEKLNEKNNLGVYFLAFDKTCK